MSFPKAGSGRSIHVAYVVNKFATGGVKSLLTSYFHHIDRDRFKIDFVVCKNGPALSDYSEIERLGGSVIEVSPISRPLAYLSDCTKVFKRRKYDIVQACMNSLNVFPLLAAKNARVPVRISYNLSTSHPGEGKSVAKNVLRPFGSLFATACAANSELAWDWLFEGGAFERKIIPNAIDLSTYYYDEDLRKRTREEFGWSQHIVVGHVGRYEYQKNHSFLVDVFKELYSLEPRARLALVGYGSLKDKIFEKARKLDIQEAVIDLGATENLNKLYNAFDCFVLPSYYEGLPVAGIEAQATGCPCLFSSEITREARAIETAEFLSLSDPASKWAEAVMRLAGKERGGGAFEVAANGFEASNAAKALEDYYFSLLRSARFESKNERHE